MDISKKYRFSPAILLFFIYFISQWPTTAQASDLAREARWREQIVASLMSGDSVDLQAGATTFLGLYTAASDGPTGRAAIVIHGIGAHPDWPEVVYPLRSELPEQGWSTLSIQMPVLGNAATAADYLPLFAEIAPRLDAAVAWLRAQGNKTIVMIAHSLGAAMAARYLADNSAAGVAGLVIIGLPMLDIDPKMNGVLALESIRVPVLDIYGSRDLDTVLSSSDRRARSARKAGNNDFRQTRIEGADHFFSGLDDALVLNIYGWLKHHYAPHQEKKP
jgi:pimeloyl-ACP methyl ester carboxylesterase